MCVLLSGIKTNLSVGLFIFLLVLQIQCAPSKSFSNIFQLFHDRTGLSSNSMGAIHLTYLYSTAIPSSRPLQLSMYANS